MDNSISGTLKEKYGDARQLIDDIWRMRWGGSLDSIGIGFVGAGFVASAPGLLSIPYFIPAISAAAGSFYVVWRLLKTIRERNVLPSRLDLKSSPLPCGPDETGVMLGYTTDQGKPFRIPDSDIMRHVLIVGQSGVGKTVMGSLMLFQQIQRGGGLIFVDAKIDVDNLNTIHRLAAWCGRSHDLRVIHPGMPGLSNSYNPLLYGDASEKASTILSTMPSSENSPGTDYYRQAANQGLRTLIGALQGAGLAYNFVDLSILLTNPKALSDLEKRIIAAAPKKPSTWALSLFLEQFKAPGRTGEVSIDMKRLKETFGGIGGRLHTFGTDSFGEIMNTYNPEVKLFDDIVSNKIIYVGLPTMGKAEDANNFGKLLIGDLRTAVSWIQALPEEERPWPPFLNFLDEAGSYATPTLARLFEQARSANMIMMPAVQTMANFEAVSPEFAAMAVGNTWTKVFFKLGEQQTAEAAADLIGMEKSVTKTIALSDNVGASHANLRATPESSASGAQGVTRSEKEEEVYRVSVDDLKALDKGECIVTFGGSELYNLRVPMAKLDKATKLALGDYRVNRMRKTTAIDKRYNNGMYKQAVDLEKEHHRYITK